MILQEICRDLRAWDDYKKSNGKNFNVSKFPLDIEENLYMVPIQWPYCNCNYSTPPLFFDWDRYGSDEISRKMKKEF